MDTVMTSSYSISPSELLPLLGTQQAPLLLDVRREKPFEASPHILKHALRSAPENVTAWAAENAAQRDQTVVVYCVYGHNVSHDAMKELRALGWNALALAGGIQGGEDGVDSPVDIAAWRAVKLPTSLKTGSTKIAAS
jgi:rhodanese-related sulfurtransferase